MAKEPEDRFGSALEFSHAMQQAQRDLGLPVTELHVAEDPVPDDVKDRIEQAEPALVPQQRPPVISQPLPTTAVTDKPTPDELGLIGASGAGSDGPGQSKRSRFRRPRSPKALALLTALVVAAFAGSGVLIANVTGSSTKTSASTVITTKPSTSGSGTDSTSSGQSGATRTTGPGKSTSKTGTGSSGGSNTDSGSSAGGGGSSTDSGTTGTKVGSGGTSVGTSTGQPAGTRSSNPVQQPVGGGSTQPVFVDHAPSLFAANQSSNETGGVNVTFSASDPDPGDHATVAVSGLPPGLSASNGHITGVIPASAANVTTNRTNIASANFTVTVVATDTREKSVSKSINWAVWDTALTMPNYFAQFGCGGCGGLPDVNAISNPTFACAYDPNGDGNHIWRQSVAPNSVIHWGDRIEYWYGKNDTTCEHIASHW
jgi:hypothetical protein